MSKEKLFCYLRVSTKSQEEEGSSIENQRHIGQTLCEKLGMEYVELKLYGLQRRILLLLEGGPLSVKYSTRRQI